MTAGQHSAWQLAPLFAGRSRVRIGRWDGRKEKWQYSTRDERDLTDEVPRDPAAVLLYNSHGQCRTLVADVDVTGAEGAALTHQVVALLERCGGRVVVDRSPAGKHHVYLPLRDGITAEDAGELAKALARRFPGVDPLPHTTGAISGCIRPPGSPYKDGAGWQELVTPLDTARRVLLTRNGSEVLGALRAALGEELAEGRREAMELVRPMGELEDEAAVVDAPFIGRVMAPRLATLAREGLFVEAGYSDRSTARMAVLGAAARAGLRFEDVTARLEDGRWAGLASLFQNANKPGVLIGKEWRKACAFVARSSNSQKSVRHCNTSEAGIVTRGAPRERSAREITMDEHRFIRRWRAVLAEVETSELAGPRGLHARFLLRALGAAAHQGGSRHVEFGVRSLSLAMPVQPSTVSRVLAELREGEDPWLVLVREGEGTRADLYELRIPQRHDELVEQVGMPAGKIHALRPAFRELGVVAALLFEAIESGAASMTTARVRAGISRSAAFEALELLEAWGLIVREETGTLRAVPKRLGEVAERVGAALVVGLLIERFRSERRKWVEYLSRHAVSEEWWAALVRDGPPSDPALEPAERCVA
ncbi:MAG: hypothetical protein L0G94_04145 [Brachybacterium sp.]|uniref:hypothetical protein n=1 Tax=Brachybacterium sp. TaxID=1891286 RepID=UPI0026492BC1|nr:hypothetical protein [Brachybacterium sp.]MDN5685861.1 hypothetical protein [Brachybacterium sp.]